MINRVYSVLFLTVFCAAAFATEATQKVSLKQKLGQMFVIYVDNYDSPDGMIHPLYKKFIRDMNIGGVVVENSNVYSVEKHATERRIELPSNPPINSNSSLTQRPSNLPSNADSSLTQIPLNLQNFPTNNNIDSVPRPAPLETWKLRASKIPFAKIMEDLKQSASTPLFVAEDQAGSQLFSSVGGEMPPPETIGSLNDPECAEIFGYLMGRQMRHFGYNIVFGPIVERFDQKAFVRHNSRTKNYLRPYYFGDQDSTVVNMSYPAMRGYFRSGVIPTMKHFPYDPIEFDSHKTLRESDKTKEEVEMATGIFSSISDKLADDHFEPIIMSTHTMNPVIDSHVATFSTKWIDQSMRGVVKNRGLMITDALFMNSLYTRDNYREIFESELSDQMTSDEMEALFYKEGPSEVNFLKQRAYKKVSTQFAIKAILAGHDLVLLEGVLEMDKAVIQGVLAAAEREDAQGSLLRARIESSYQRISSFKERNRTYLTASSVPFPTARADEFAQAVEQQNPQICKELLAKLSSK